MNATFADLPRRSKKLARPRIGTDYYAFGLFFILTCIPGFSSVEGANLSVLLFPLVFFGYSKAATRNFARLQSGARKAAFAIIAIMLVLCCWDLVTAVGAESFLRVFRPLFGHASGLAVVLAILALSSTPADAKRTRSVCIIILTIALAATYLVGPRAYGDRYPGTFKHPNQLGIVAGMVGIHLFCEGIVGLGRRRVWPVVGCLLAIYATLLSGSKTNLLLFAGLALISVWLLAMLRGSSTLAMRELGRNLTLAICVILAGTLALSLTNERAFSVLNDLASGDEAVGTYHSVEDRDQLWRESIEKFDDNPLRGVGAGQLLSDGTEHSHNIFMDAIRTTGAPGLGLTAGFVLAIVWYVVGAYTSARRLMGASNSRLAHVDARGPFVGSLCAMVLYLFANQMSDSFGPSTIPFFYMYFAFSLSYFLPFGNALNRNSLPQNASQSVTA